MYISCSGIHYSACWNVARTRVRTISQQDQRCIAWGSRPLSIDKLNCCETSCNSGLLAHETSSVIALFPPPGGFWRCCCDPVVPSTISTHAMLQLPSIRTPCSKLQPCGQCKSTDTDHKADNIPEPTQFKKATVT